MENPVPTAENNERSFSQDLVDFPVNTDDQKSVPSGSDRVFIDENSIENDQNPGQTPQKNEQPVFTAAFTGSEPTERENRISPELKEISAADPFFDTLRQQPTVVVFPEQSTGTEYPDPVPITGPFPEDADQVDESSPTEPTNPYEGFNESGPAVETKPVDQVTNTQPTDESDSDLQVARDGEVGEGKLDNPKAYRLTAPENQDIARAAQERSVSQHNYVVTLLRNHRILFAQREQVVALQAERETLLFRERDLTRQLAEAVQQLRTLKQRAVGQQDGAEVAAVYHDLNTQLSQLKESNRAYHARLVESEAAELKLKELVQEIDTELKRGVNIITQHEAFMLEIEQIFTDLCELAAQYSWFSRDFFVKETNRMITQRVTKEIDQA